MTTNNLSQRVQLLHAVPWGTARGWSQEASDLLLQHYQRLLPYWPEGRSFLPPADRELEHSVLAALDVTTRERIEQEVDDIVSEARLRGQRLESTTRHLLPLILAWAVYIDEGRLQPEADPAAPLILLFQRGYQLNYTEAGVEFHFFGGRHTDRVPKRSEVIPT